MKDEVEIHTVQAIRKGRGRLPCEVKVGITDDGYVVLRTVDKGGTSPIVALIKPSETTELCEALLKATHALRHHAPAAKKRRQSSAAG